MFLDSLKRKPRIKFLGKKYTYKDGIKIATNIRLEIESVQRSLKNPEFTPNEKKQILLKLKSLYSFRRRFYKEVLFDKRNDNFTKLVSKSMGRI